MDASKTTKSIPQKYFIQIHMYCSRLQEENCFYPKTIPAFVKISNEFNER